MNINISSKLMMKLSISIVACILMISTNAIAQDLTNALEKIDAKWGETCDKCEYYKGYERSFEDTYTVFFRNTSNIIIDVQVAVQEKNLAWRIYQFRGIHPLDELSTYACQGTGKYLYWVKKENDPELIFPSEEKVNNNYN